MTTEHFSNEPITEWQCPHCDSRWWWEGTPPDSFATQINQHIASHAPRLGSLSRRDHFAAAALNVIGAGSSEYPADLFQKIAKSAVGIADALIAELDKPK